MTLETMLLFLCLCVVVENSAAQCPVATILPSEVAPSIADEFFTAQLTKPIEELQQTVASMLQADRGDVYSMAVVYRNSTIFSAGLVETPFRIGSMTKAFVAMGTLLLRKQGALALDDPVKKLLPGFSVINPFHEAHDITLRELMGHTSGLPRNLCAGLFCDPDDIPEDEALASIAQMQLARPPWSSLPLYSNLGFAILGHAWEKATSPRQTWSQFLRDELLTPLQMRDTGVPADLAGVELAPGNVSASYSANYSLGWQAPAGDMYSTAADLAKFLKFLLHPDARVLSNAAIREMTHPATVFPDGIGAFALPWELLAINNVSTPLITKDGGLGTYHSLLAFHPESQLGVAVLTSVINQNASSSGLAVQIMEDLIPEVQAVHATFISSLYAGEYMCNRTAPVESAQFRNVTVQMLGGRISVTTMTPDKNLVLVHNVSVELNGDQTFLVGSRSLVLKPGGAGENSTTFWSSPAPCIAMASLISSDPEVARPNFPDSVNFFEFSFQGSLLRWSALGGMCYKA